MSGVASWGAFLDNVTMLETVLDYYKKGRGNGRLEHYIYANGQCQESGRDQGEDLRGPAMYDHSSLFVTVHHCSLTRSQSSLIG